MGLETATLKWNEVVDVEKQKERDKNGLLSPSASSDIPSPTSSNDDVEAVAASSVETAASDIGLLLETHELRGITVPFPEGQLSIVTGPTAFGKVALVRCRVPPLSALF